MKQNAMKIESQLRQENSKEYVESGRWRDDKWKDLEGQTIAVLDYQKRKTEKKDKIRRQIYGRRNKENMLFLERICQVESKTYFMCIQKFYCLFFPLRETSNSSGTLIKRILVQWALKQQYVSRKVSKEKIKK